MAKILALDISSISTGFAVLNDGYLDGYGIISSNTKLQYGARLVYFQNEIKQLIQLHKPTIITIEEIFKGRNMNTFKSLAMFRGIAVKTINEETGKDPVVLLAVAARAILGFGSSKEDAFKKAIPTLNLTKLNFKFDLDNDIVDAIILARAVEKLLKDNNGKPLQNSGRRKKRKPKRNKKLL
jgi:Holliday junction resolvasome RuvABC endonuclease subunit